MTLEASPPKIAVRGVAKRFRGDGTREVVALEAVDLTIAPGEFLALLGPSGCGKTTLLRMLAGLETPSAGSVAIDGRPIAGPSEQVSFVFQSAVLLPWRTILDNVLLPSEVQPSARRRSTDRSEEWTSRARELLAMTGLADFADHYPRQLSGGMRQRAAICRALLTDPEILLMDEPFGALDAMTRDTMNGELYQLWQRSGKTIVFVTHDIAEAVRLATRVAVMTPRPGKVERIVATDFPHELPYAERVDSPQCLERVHALRLLFANRVEATA